MEAGTQVRFPKTRPSIMLNRRPNTLVFSTLEESKRLENLNRQIVKSSNQNMIKFLSDYRKSTSPNTQTLKNKDSCLCPEAAQKKTLDPFIYCKNPSEICSELADPDRPRFPIANDIKKKSRAKEFSSIDFKETLWPDELIIDDGLYEVIIENDRGRIEERTLNLKTSQANRRIKSRIGELNRTSKIKPRKMRERNSRRLSLRVWTPWVYNNDPNTNACLCTPYTSANY